MDEARAANGGGGGGAPPAVFFFVWEGHGSPSHAMDCVWRIPSTPGTTPALGCLDSLPCCRLGLVCMRIWGGSWVWGFLKVGDRSSGRVGCAVAWSARSLSSTRF
jgi:hypothetical protein